MYKFLIHYGLHFVFTAIIAYFLFNKNWKKVYIIFILTMIVDFDHLIAIPIFDPFRCSINFHPLHTYYAIGVYFFSLFFKKTQIIGLGLLLHMFADLIDCFIH